MSIVSIIIPVRNRAHMIKPAMDSCRTNDLNPEVIVVDDASMDETARCVELGWPEARVVRSDRRLGPCGARNVGLRAATGRYVKFLDSDDYLIEGALDREVVEAEQTNCDILLTGWIEERMTPRGEVRTSVKRRAPVFAEDRHVECVLAGRAVPTSAALYRRELVRIHEWDTALPKLNDWDWFVRAALEASKISTLPICSYTMLHHDGDRVSNAGILTNALCHHKILRKIQRWLSERGQLDHARRARLAQYYYKELRVLALHRAPEFEMAVRTIYDLDPHFFPRDEERQFSMRVLARLVGMRTAIRLHCFAKRTLLGEPATTSGEPRKAHAPRA